MLSKQPAFVAGQLKFHLHQWERITSDPFVLSCVNNCKIEPSPAKNNFNPQYKFSIPKQQAIDNEVTKFLSKSIIEETHSESGEVISPIFIRPKKEPGKFRVILNLKRLNEAVTYRFKMVTLEWTL